MTAQATATKRHYAGGTPFYLVQCDDAAHGPIVLNSGHHYRNQGDAQQEADRHNAAEHGEKMATVTIYHRNDRDRFMEASYGSPTYEWAYAYETDNWGLETIWRANNHVDGSPVEVLPNISRSLSVGDVVEIVPVVGKATYHSVDSFGFSEINGNSMTIVEKEEV